MPKRNAQEKIERYQRKIQKLREMPEKRRRMRVVYSDSSDDEGTEVARSVANAEFHNHASLIAASPSTATVPAPVPEPVPETAPMIDLTSDPGLPVPEDHLLEQVVEAVQTEETMPEPDLDPELLEALGESTSDTPEYGDKIHENLANLWLPLLRKGIPKEGKEKILKDYLIPDNCRLLQSPNLNPEISAAVPDVVRNRDKSLAYQQQQLGSGMTAVNRTLDLLLKGGDKKQAIQHLSNACRILSDLHATFTQNRIKLISSCLDKKFLHVIQDSQRDETLFGNKLSEKIKAANAIERQGQQIRKNNPKFPNGPQSASNKASTSGNWTPPPRYLSNRGGRGGQRKPVAQNRRYYPNSTHSQQKPAVQTTTKPRPPPTQ